MGTPFPQRRALGIYTMNPEAWSANECDNRTQFRVESIEQSPNILFDPVRDRRSYGALSGGVLVFNTHSLYSTRWKNPTCVSGAPNGPLEGLRGLNGQAGEQRAQGPQKGIQGRAGALIERHACNSGVFLLPTSRSRAEWRPLQPG